MPKRLRCFSARSNNLGNDHLNSPKLAQANGGRLLGTRRRSCCRRLRGRPAREVALDGPETILAPMWLAPFNVKRRHAPQAEAEQGGTVVLGDCAPRGVGERRMNLSGGNTGAFGHLQQTLI